MGRRPSQTLRNAAKRRTPAADAGGAIINTGRHATMTRLLATLMLTTALWAPFAAHADDATDRVAVARIWFRRP